MALTNLAARIQTTPYADDVVVHSKKALADGAALRLDGTVGSIPAFLLSHLHQKLATPLLCLVEQDDNAAYLRSDLEQVGVPPETILYIPPTGAKPYDTEQVADATPLIQRADALQQLKDGFTGLVLTSVEALYECVPPPEVIASETLTLEVGVEVDPRSLIAQLVSWEFERVEFVEQPGEIALRGGILDIYPFTGAYPIRIEFFGEEIDTIREFEVHTQRSISRLSQARIVPNIEREHEELIVHEPLFAYLPDGMLVVVFNQQSVIDTADQLFGKAEEAYTKHKEEEQHAHAEVPATRYLNGATLETHLLQHPRVLIGAFSGYDADVVLPYDARPQPSFSGNLTLLRKHLRDNQLAGMETFILCDNRGQEDRMRELLSDEIERRQVQIKLDTLHEGFEIPSLGLAVYTDHQIFNRYHRPSVRKRKRQLGGLNMRDLLNLTPGDFVVHIDYGIGRFEGMKKIEVRGRKQEAVQLSYLGGDTLYVNINALYKLHKYTGKEGHQPRLTKLGSGQWERTKSKTKKRLKDIARDLIKLYAKRKASQGYAFPIDTVWQRELEASFQYEDTPDQGAAAEAVKRDMEQPIPMDRLVCGDVGFGKTEIAVRAAFKAVQDGQQVAVLVPTTILAAQHAETFKKRLGQFPVKVESISRFRTRAEQKEVIKRLKEGDVDVLIGTHRIVSKDIQFKSLGLLIIDEEQRFGVAVKEKLRQFRVNVDTLTLTATPIPRTLQFSLLGARDLSIIATAPPNRQPINTEIHTFDKDLIRDGILYEVNRGGQVFFIHNRVKSIEEIADTLRQLVPDIRIRVAHGQMKSSELEQVMMDFMERKFDVLVSTNIIESGLDISNANTIIINRADHFGLAELHQLRGRVGRSNMKAFCYLLVPSIHGLTREAKQRLKAVEEFSELGSGFNIAMRDLDIRGAGSMLGAEQSGFIEDVGYETYHKILEEAVQELRQEEFADVFKDSDHVPPGPETTVEVDADAYIPGTYIANNVERLNLYRRISDAESEEVLIELVDEIKDRFGPVPEEVYTLLDAVRLKLLAQPLRLNKVIYKNERLFLETPTQEQDPYFYQHIFHPLLGHLNTIGHRFVIRETKRKRVRAIIQQVSDLPKASRIIEQLKNKFVEVAPSEA